MKTLHRPGFYGWSGYDEARDIDFNGLCLVRPEGNVLVDPMPMGSHDVAHLLRLGGAAWVVLTTSDHTRAVRDLVGITGARVAAPAAERGAAALEGIEVERWLDEAHELVAGVRVLALHGSKTPGELALLVDGHTLVCGDLVRSHRAGHLTMLPEAKLAHREAAVASVRRLAELEVEAVLVGDGTCAWRDGRARLVELVAALGQVPDQGRSAAGKLR